MKGEQRNTKISQLSTKLNELKQVLMMACMYVCTYLHNGLYLKYANGNNGITKFEFLLFVMYVHLFILQLLTNAEKSFHQSQSFQGGFSEIYKEENPLAGILTTAYGVRIT